MSFAELPAPLTAAHLASYKLKQLKAIAKTECFEPGWQRINSSARAELIEALVLAKVRRRSRSRVSLRAPGAELPPELRDAGAGAPQRELWAFVASVREVSEDGGRRTPSRRAAYIRGSAGGDAR